MPNAMQKFPFSSVDVSALTSAGLLTLSHSPSNAAFHCATSGASSAGTLSSLPETAAKSASGSLAAVGGAEAAVHIPNGVPCGRAGPAAHAQYNFALPNTGALLHLIKDARSHLLTLLRKSPRAEAPLDVLRERWDGGVSTLEDAHRSVRRSPGVLPGRTRKWKQFYGLAFEWILEECVGADLVELFRTGSVGMGVRAA